MGRLPGLAVEDDVVLGERLLAYALQLVLILLLRRLVLEGQQA